MKTGFNIQGITCNSKDVRQGYCFVAVKGHCYDGNKFIDEAIQKGAKVIIVQSRGEHCSPVKVQSAKFKNKAVFFVTVGDTRMAAALLADEFYAHPSGKIKVIGVTGTNGKTTITYLIEAILKKAGMACAVIGTINYRFKDKLIPAKNTTPGPVELQALLSRMLKEKIPYCAMEVSSHALDQERVLAINFHSAIFTNLTHDHLDYHKTMEKYFQAKAILFKSLGPKAFTVINSDDKFGLRLKRLSGQRVVTYGIENKADIRARNLELDCCGARFNLVYPSGKIISFKSGLIGRHNVYNVLAAVSWAHKAGISMEAVKLAVESFLCAPGRLEKVDVKRDFSVFVDYAHTPDALKNVISALRALTKTKIITVFGCGGERDKTKRPKMGGIVTMLSDYAFITNDNPRREDPFKIIADIKKGIKKDNYYIIPERMEAIKKALSMAGPGDIVLIAGKGHENYQILKEKKEYFNDKGAVQECLKSRIY